MPFVKIVMEASKDFFGKYLFRNENAPSRMLFLEELESNFYSCKELNSFNLRNMVSLFSTCIDLVLWMVSPTLKALAIWHTLEEHIL